MGIVRRIPQLPAVIFKGSGWYSTDQRSAHNHKTDLLKNKQVDRDGGSPGEKSKS